MEAEAIALESMAEIEHGFEWRWEPSRVSEVMADPEANVVVAVDGRTLLGFGFQGAHPALWDDDPFTNWTAFDATCCIACLLELGIAPDELEHKARQLSRHACKGNRDSCATFLGRQYDWIPAPDPGSLGLPSWPGLGCPRNNPKQTPG